MSGTHVVQFSGGVGSWAAAKRIVSAVGSERLVLLFADVLMEDEDLYRFIDEAAANVGGEFVRVSAGETPWQLFKRQKMIGNTRADLCSRILKRELLDRWVRENCERGSTLYFGIDWSEVNRFQRLSKQGRWPGMNLSAPLCEPPYLSKADMIESLRREGIEPPRLYALGFPHNNCGGFCVKAGQAHFARLLKAMPERYRWHERQEEETRSIIGKDVSILRDRRGGATKPLTLRAFRERLEHGGQFDLNAWGGCGCAL